MAKALAGAGAYVILHGRAHGPLEAAILEIEANGGKASARTFELTETAAIAKAVAEITAELGAIDILINNAGYRDRRGLEEIDLPAMGHVLEIDLIAPFELARRNEAGKPAGGRTIHRPSIAGNISRSGAPDETAPQAGPTERKSAGGG